jgi:hypothetical protein
MNNLSRQIIALFLVLFTLTTGCRSAKEYANLAQAGTTYAAALDSLLVATGNIELDTTSERLLQDRTLANISLEQYRNLSNQDENLLQLITQLRQHVRLLSRYFGLLYELATSDAPDRAKKAIGDGTTGVIGNLNSIGNQLRGSGFLPGNVAAAAAPITGVIVSGIIRAALKDELNARKDTIQKELLLQEQLLKVLSDRISHDLAITQETREQRLVLAPLMGPTPIAKPDDWIANRRSVLTMKLTADQLKTASDDVKKLREAFEDLVSGKLTLDRVDSLLTDFNSLLTVAEKLKG